MKTEPKKVLLIEDDVDLRETTSELLVHEGFNVMIAENGSEGVQKAIQFRPDIIICDITMPGITGYEVFNILRQINSTALIPFVFLSAKSAKEDILLGLHIGVDDYITKPFDIKSLIKVINLRIENRKKVIEINDEKFNVLLRNTYSGALIINKQIIEYSNGKFAKALGYAQDELIGNNLINIVHKDDVKNIADLLHRCSEGVLKEFESDFKSINKDNSLTPFKIKGSVIDYKGEKRVVITVHEQNEDEVISNNPFSRSIKLTNREVEILNNICQGLSNAEIAKKLFLSERTIEGHRARIFDKTGTKNAVSLALWAVKNKVINI